MLYLMYAHAPQPHTSLKCTRLLADFDDDFATMLNIFRCSRMVAKDFSVVEWSRECRFLAILEYGAMAIFRQCDARSSASFCCRYTARHILSCMPTRHDNGVRCRALLRYRDASRRNDSCDLMIGILISACTGREETPRFIDGDIFRRFWFGPGSPLYRDGLIDLGRVARYTFWRRLDVARMALKSVMAFSCHIDCFGCDATLRFYLYDDDVDATILVLIGSHDMWECRKLTKKHAALCISITPECHAVEDMIRACFWDDVRINTADIIGILRMQKQRNSLAAFYLSIMLQLLNIRWYPSRCKTWYDEEGALPFSSFSWIPLLTLRAFSQKLSSHTLFRKKV